MKKIPYLIAFFTLFNSFLLNAQINFTEGSWKDVLAKAQKENKHIFVDAYAEWCGPCKMMAKNVFTDKNVGEFYNQNYVNYKFDMEKGEGPEFAQKYKVGAYPTLLYFNPKGELAHKGIGGRDVDGFIGLGKDAIDPDKQLLTLQNKFDKGERSKTFMQKFLNALRQTGEEEKIATIANEYLKSIPQKEWTSEDNIEYLSNAAKININIVDFALKNKKEFEKNKMGNNHYNNILFLSILPEVEKIFNDKNTEEYKKLKDQNLKKFGDQDGKKINARLDVFFAQYVEGKGFEEKLDVYADEFCDDWVELSQFASMYSQGNDTKALEKALKYINKAEKVSNNNPTILFASATILKKLNRQEDAKKKANQALNSVEKDEKSTIKQNIEQFLNELK
jgi:thiol-disulfide isomerase/thioredoxin